MVANDVINGQIQSNYTETDQTKKTSGSELGKDAFLQLLTTQLQYQDPMNPMDNTAMVSQLAQFSALEEMQNVSGAINNMQAMSLVGKNVIMEVGKSSGSANTTTVGGYVELVQIVDGKAKLSINGQLYDYEDFEMVVDDKYLEGILGGGSEDDKTEGAGDDKTEGTEDDKTEGTEDDKTEGAGDDNTGESEE